MGAPWRPRLGGGGLAEAFGQGGAVVFFGQVGRGEAFFFFEGGVGLVGEEEFDGAGAGVAAGGVVEGGAALGVGGVGVVA